MMIRLIVVTSLLALLPGCRPSAPASKPDEHSVINASGETISISSLFNNELTVLIFTDTTCPIANRFAPTINALHQEFPSVNFLLIFPDPDTDAGAILQHLEDYSLSLNFLRDPRHHLVNWTGATHTPEAALYRNSSQLYLGRINDRFVDFGVERNHITSHDLAEAIKASLAGEPIEISKTSAIGCQIPSLP